MDETMTMARQIIQDVNALLNADQVVGLYCRQSVGRSGMMAAAILYCGCDENRSFLTALTQDKNSGFHAEQSIVDGGWSVEEAFDMIEQARGCLVPDTVEQRRWVEKYARLQATLPYHNADQAIYI